MTTLALATLIGIALALTGVVVWIFLDDVMPHRRREDAFLAALRAINAQQMEFMDRLTATQEHQSEAILQTVAEMAKATQAQAAALSAHVASFEISAPTRTRIVREADEVAAYHEQMRHARESQDEALRSAGYPVGASPADQLHWVDLHLRD